MLNLGPYGKTIAAVIIGVLGWAAIVVDSASSSITSHEWLIFGTALATALGVYTIANAPGSTPGG